MIKPTTSNKITVLFDGRTLRYNPARLSGVSVYYEAERAFAEGDRLQIRAPFREKRIANGELGTITKIEPDHIRLAMDSGREITVDLRKFRHLDYGYAVTSYSAQGLTFDRVLINADTRIRSPTQRRTAYVAISRARYDADLYRLQAESIRCSQPRNRKGNGAWSDTRRRTREEEIAKVIKDRPAPQQQLPFDQLGSTPHLSRASTDPSRHVCD